MQIFTLNSSPFVFDPKQMSVPIDLSFAPFPKELIFCFDLSFSPPMRSEEALCNLFYLGVFHRPRLCFSLRLILVFPLQLESFRICGLLLDQVQAFHHLEALLFSFNQTISNLPTLAILLLHEFLDLHQNL